MRTWALPLAVLTGALVRAPFWIEALRTPLDGDAAVIGLMARHPWASATMWGQPYGSPVEAWMVAPAVALLGTRTESVRLVYFLLGLALIPAGAWLASALHPRAGLPAAFLLACPPPYFFLLAALPPPLYPTALLLLALLLGGVIRVASRPDAAAGPPPWTLVLCGLAAGLALWTHLMSAAIVGLCALYLGRRVRPASLLAWTLPAFLLACAPLWLHARDGRATRILRPADREETLSRHLRDVVPQLHEPVGGLLGAHVPIVADDPEHVVYAPRPAAAGVILAYGLLVVAVLRQRARPSGVTFLLGCAAAILVVFPFALRSSPASIRFLTPAMLPLIAAAAWFLAARTTPRRTAIAVLVMGLLHLGGASRLLQAWRLADRRDAPFRLPDLGPLQRALADHGVRRAYAPYGPAYRLTFEGGERLLVSQPWNERFRHEPLPYLDEVRFARNVAWILFPGVPTDLPSPRAFEDALGQIGGAGRKLEIGDAVVFLDFAPPFAPAVESCPDAGAAGDRDLGTSVPVDAATTFTFPARALDALSLVGPSAGARLPRGLDVEVSADGETFERVVRRRRREERLDLRWVNGHPQYVIDDDFVSAALGGRTISAVRLTPVDTPEPAVLGELLLHPRTEPAWVPAPWDEWLDPTLDWKDRRARLEATPRLDRADWYYRSLLAARER